MATDATRAAPARMTARARGLLLVVCGALFLEGINIAMLQVAVPSIAADIGLATGTAHWVISAYVLGYGGFMLLGGRASDLLGRRKIFLTSLLLFIVFSGVGGIATDSWMLIMSRFATGAAAGFMTPAGFSLVTSGFPEGTLRNRALAVYGAIGAGGFTLGNVAGGLLAALGWRAVFFAPMVLGAGLFVAGMVLIRPDEAQQSGRFDIGGAITVTGGMVAVIYGLVTLGEGGNIGAGAAGLAVGMIMIVAFLGIERRASQPLVRLGLLRTGGLPAASIAGMLLMAGLFGFQFAITLYLQDLRNWSPVETGLTFAIMGLDMILAPIVTPRLVTRFGNLWVMTAGLASAAIAYGLALRLRADWNYLDLLPSMLLVGIAFTLVYGPLAAAATEGLAESEHGVAGGVVYTAFQFGSAVGLAMVTIVLLKGGHGAAELTDYRRALLVPAAFAVVGVLVGVLSAVRQRRRAKINTYATEGGTS